MNQTKRSLLEIEIALSKHSTFSFLRNILAFNVLGEGSEFYIGHECDMLVLSKSGYLTEIEIKRSWSDFLADFKKGHNHDSELIKYFYYCIPEDLLDKAYDKLQELDVDYSGIITYSENLNIQLHGKRVIVQGEERYIYPAQRHFRKLFLEEQLQIARYGAMRVVRIKESLLRKQQKNKDTGINI